MDIIFVANNLGAFISTSLGVLAVFSPASTAKLVGISATEPRGVSDIRATYGGIFLATGAYCFWSQDQTAFFVLGIGWLGAAIVRLFSIFIDKASSRLNFGGLFLEFLVACLLLLRK